MEKISMS